MGSYPSGTNGYARVDPSSPIAFACCDRCGFRYNRTDLTWQLDWRGNSLQNLRILVCRRTCLDIPNDQLRSFSPPADPLPVHNPRPDQSYQGLAPIIIYTIASIGLVPVLDGFGNPVLDGYGNWISDGHGVGNAQLIGPGVGRTLVNFDLPASFGLWINLTGGFCSPGAPNCVFYSPNSYFEVFGAAANNALTYYTTIVGLLIVVQSQ
jgi:hypothetical protein